MITLTGFQCIICRNRSLWSLNVTLKSHQTVRPSYKIPFYWLLQPYKFISISHTHALYLYRYEQIPMFYSIDAVYTSTKSTSIKLTEIDSIKTVVLRTTEKWLQKLINSIPTQFYTRTECETGFMTAPSFLCL